MRVPIRLGFALLLALAPAASGRAAGFAVHDLTSLGPDMEKTLGPGFVHRAEARRVTLTCLGCAANPMIDVLLGRQDDGTEDRVRAGETTIARLEAICREKDPACRLTALEIAPAVGWMSHWRMADRPGATVVILRDGDLLTIRSLADTDAVARANAEKLVTAIGGRVVGR
ncbi:hypothetical protein HL653_21115 [Sphingomonas sp. AP4-R1]|uniref:hypothetical protein n=1 Tax=Sphingomonas sp. AP4-R1 TaxID=2735134 RepID=UPI001493CA55|nr:hypothetical protein [Sphingomonas sp. AP4-R1]QJU59911.1 hypothetical protein HL653_21115 [Sphingomonas sp. AP4-R1]